MRHFPLTKTDWRSERSRGGSERGGSRRGGERERERERGIVAGAHGLPSRWSCRSPGCEVGREKDPCSLALPWGTVQPRGLKRGRGRRRVNEGPGVAMPFATPTDGATGIRENAKITLISSRAHQVWIANINRCQLALRPRRRPSCLIVRVQPAFHLLP